MGALSLILAGTAAAVSAPPADSVRHLGHFPVVELRRYRMNEGMRDRFAEYFESFFPEAFEQLGALALGQFLERHDPSRFTWLRGFHSLDERATVNGAFYDGPLWKEHRTAANAMIADSDDVLLLQSLSPDRDVIVLPAVDPHEAHGARGIVVAQIFPVKRGEVEAFARRAEPAFAGYRSAGAREAGVLATLDVPNNFPRHPIRTDGPFLVWLGIVQDDLAADKALHPLAERAARELASTNLLRGDPEFVVLEPTRRSRLRWLP